MDIKRYTVICFIVILLSKGSGEIMATKLHDAMIVVITDAKHSLTSTEKALAINKGKLYLRKDGRPIPATQMSARASNYPQMFIRENSSIDILKSSITK